MFPWFRASSEIVTDENTAAQKSERICDVCKICNMSKYIFDLTWQPLGFIRQHRGEVAIFADHDCDWRYCLVGDVYQNTAVRPGYSCVCSGAVDIDVHPCIADPPTTQRISDPDL